MNKYEQLIEYIINDQEDKARELFHSIVVAKSRDIYESLMDEEIGGTESEDLVDEVSADETMEADDEFDGEEPVDGEEEFSMGDEEGADDEMGGDLGDDMGGDEFGGEEEMGGEADKFQDIRDAIDELEAQFAEISGEGGDDMGAEMGDGEIEGGDEMAADDMGGEEDFGGDDEVGAPPMESANPFAKSGSGKSGSGKSGSGSGKSGSGKSGSGKAAPKNESKSVAELMREYVEKISDGHGAEKKGEAEGKEIGAAGSSVSVNKANPVAGKNDMGGTAANIVSGKGDDNSERDGNTPKGKAGGFVKAPQEIDVAKRNVNKVGGNKGAQDFYKTKAKAKDSEGSTTKDSVPVNKDSLGYPNK